MANILAYTSPALGHLFPITALLTELHRRGHSITLRTLADGVAIGSALGFATQPIDPRIESIRQHLQRYRDLTSQGKWADAGRELEAIQNEVQK